MTSTAAPIDAITPADATTLEAVQTLDQKMIEVARHDADTFMEYVLRDESTGAAIQQSPVQSDWHKKADQHDRLLIWSHIESGKSSQISVGRTLWTIGREPNARIAIVSNTHEQAGKLVRTIAKYIENSSELRRVFPKLLKADPWTGHQLFVQRPTTAKDPSVQSTGIHGNITGARIDYLILDDMLDYENTRTAAMRDDLWNWYHATLSGRLTANARVIVIGTAYHPEDFLHRLATTAGWKAFRYPAVMDDGITPRWPDRWPPSRLARKRQELGPLEYARQMLCVARDDAESRFKKEWIDRCLHRGAGKFMCRALAALPPGIRTYTGVDLAVQRHNASDSTVLFTIAVHPNGDREVLNIESGKWTGPEIVGRMLDNHRRFFSIVRVENNAAQDFILQFARGLSAIPLQAHTTGRNKANPEFGVESIATEMANGKWIIPSGAGSQLAPEVEKWIREMLYYDPMGHTGDRLMASWFAREGARVGSVQVQRVHLDTVSR